MDYWEECIRESFDEAGIEATKEQIDTVVSWVDGAHENYGMAFGHDAIPNPMESEVDKLKKRLAKQQEEYEAREFIFKNSVARRRNIDVSRVYLEGDSVMISRG